MLQSLERVTMDPVIRALKVFWDDPALEMILFPTLGKESQIFFSSKSDFEEKVSPERLYRRTVTGKLSMYLSVLLHLVDQYSSVNEMRKWC
jgi:hypothetical protein